MNTNTGLPAPSPDLLQGSPSLFLDFDGTLVDFADRHDAIIVPPRLPGLVAAVASRLGGRLAVVSGRPAHEIAAYLRIEGKPPGYAIAGSHGLELLWPDGRSTRPDPPPALAEAIVELQAFAAGLPGVLVEEKPLGAALHFRRAPEQAAACAALAEAMAIATGLSLQRGNMVCELRADGADKGDAVRAFLAEPPMRGTRPLFLGDDLTDESGFEAAETLGGAGLLVGDRSGATTARYRLENVAAVHAWLGAIAGVPA